MSLNPKDVEAAIFHAEQYWAFSEPDNDVRDLLVEAASEWLANQKQTPVEEPK